MSIALCQCLRITCQCKNSWTQLPAVTIWRELLVIAASCRVICNSQTIWKSPFAWSLGVHWVWYSQKVLGNAAHLKKLCLRNAASLMPISYEIWLVKLFILDSAMQPKKQGFAWWWPQSALTELNVKFATMKNIVVECPQATLTQSPLPGCSGFCSFQPYILQAWIPGKRLRWTQAIFLLGWTQGWSGALAQHERALPPAIHRWRCYQISPLTLILCPQLFPVTGVSGIK